MRIVIDIDGTICETKKPRQTYDQLRVNPGAAEKIKALKAEGHYIILQTARHMKTTGGDVAKVIEKVGKITEDWLKANGIVYDEIHFGKPYNQILIDDRAFVFEGWGSFEPKDFDGEQVNLVVDLYHRNAEVKDLEAIEGELRRRQIKYQLFFLAKDQAQEKILKSKFKQAVIIPTQDDSGLSRALAAKQYINNLQQLVICQAKNFSLVDFWKPAEEPNVYGIIAIKDDKTEVKKDEWGFVEKVAAHQSSVDSNQYYFRCGRDFVSCANQLTAKSQKESVASCYNELVNRGQQVLAI